MATSEVDLVVVGAGAAGLAAAHAALAAGRSVQVLEAAERVGGRALTTRVEGVPFDLGCHYIHHASRNPFGALAMLQGVRMQLDLHARSTPEWLVVHGQEQDPARRDACAAYYKASFDAMQQSRVDVAVDEVVDTRSPFYPLLQAWIAAHYGSQPELTSALDVARHQDLTLDWPVRTGYGALVAGMADGIPVALRQSVRALRRIPGGVEVTADHGALRARAVVVTVSVEVLRRGAIVFEPGLPERVLGALDGVRMGHAERLAFHTRKPLVGSGVPREAHVLPAAGPAVQVYLHEFDDPLATVYLAGDLAYELSEDGPEAMLDYAEDALVELLGSEVRAQLGARKASGWTRDPWIRGGYSVARPGRAIDREALAEPFDERIRLAGEACSLEHFGTTHGAWASGVEAVSDLLNGGWLG